MMTPEQFTALISAIAVLIAAVTGLLVAVSRWHAQVNSRMDQLLELTRTSSRAEGVASVRETPKE